MYGHGYGVQAEDSGREFRWESGIDKTWGRRENTDVRDIQWLKGNKMCLFLIVANGRRVPVCGVWCVVCVPEPVCF